MYAMITRRTTHRERRHEALQRAETEFFSGLRQAPGFVHFYLVDDDEQGIITAVVVWEDKAQADAFGQTTAPWRQTLKELGETLETVNRGEVVSELAPQK
jgi:quinol monooxygenase YgiN